MKRIFGNTLFVFIFINLVLLDAAQAESLTIEKIRFGDHIEKKRVVIETNKKTGFRAFIEDQSLLVRLDASLAEKHDVPETNANSLDFVSNVLIKRNGHKKTFITIALNSDFIIGETFWIPPSNTNKARLVIDLKSQEGQTKSDPIVTEVQNIPSPPQKRPKSPVKPQKTSFQKRHIILDPGHGGYDPGAIGVNGLLEKDFTLLFAQEFRSYLKGTGRYTVGMTRENDKAIKLFERVYIAQSQNTDLFISIHADSIQDKTLTGASVYTLSKEATDKQTALLARQANRADGTLQELAPDLDAETTSILIDFMGREMQEQSFHLADLAVLEFKNNDIEVINKAHRSANFAVLKGLDIPSILLECGFLSNPFEEKRLKNPIHRQNMYIALTQAIDQYFSDVANLQQTVP